MLVVTPKGQNEKHEPLDPRDLGLGVKKINDQIQQKEQTAEVMRLGSYKLPIRPLTRDNTEPLADSAEPGSRMCRIDG